MSKPPRHTDARPPETLGEKLGAKLAAVGAPELAPAAVDGWGAWVGYILANTAILTLLTVLPFVWVYLEPDHRLFETIMLGLVGVWMLLSWIAPRLSRHMVQAVPKRGHFLLRGDKLGFRSSLRMAQKTVLFDGSNLYHFGLDHDLGATPVRLIAQQLRAEGYRIVSFFDANIFYKLIEHGDYPADQRHDITLLQATFGLTQNEVYVVPGGVTADVYILSTLQHLPLSFAISNDRFRDHAKTYGTVMKGNLWRKGIVLSKNEIRLKGHRFKNPVRLARAA